MLKLIKPTPKYKDSFLAAVREFQAEERQSFPIVQMIDVEAIEKDFASYVQACLNGRWPPPEPDWGSSANCWLVDEDEVLGLINIRHRLTEASRRVGGHVSFGIRPSQRRKGYATQMLEMAVWQAHNKLGMNRVMLTCDVDNIASQKVIQANGGVLEDVIKLDGVDPEPTIMRWWIGSPRQYDRQSLLKAYIRLQDKRRIEMYKRYDRRLFSTLQEALGIELSQDAFHSCTENEIMARWLYSLFSSAAAKVHTTSIQAWGEGGPEGGLLQGLHEISGRNTRITMYRLSGDEEQNAVWAKRVLQVYEETKESLRQSSKLLEQLSDALFELIYGDVDTVVTSDDLLALGFDDSQSPYLRQDWWDD
jgi:predicted acetyltransferase